LAQIPPRFARTNIGPVIPTRFLRQKSPRNLRQISLRTTAPLTTMPSPTLPEFVCTTICTTHCTAALT
jgi:hypothetical protein